MIGAFYKRNCNWYLCKSISWCNHGFIALA